MTELRKNHHIVGIDVLESIAMLLVLVYHSSLYSYDFVSDGSPVYYLRYFFNTLLSAGVPLFFFINGYLLLGKDINLKKHVTKTIRLIILTCLWGGIKLLILMPIKGEFMSISELVKALWNWRNGWINTLWYLGALICIYILFPIIKSAYDNNKSIFKYFLVVVGILTIGNTLLNQLATVVLVVAGKNVMVQGINLFNIFNPFRGILGYSICYFCMGGYMHEIMKKDYRKPVPVYVAIIIVSCALLFLVGLCYAKAQGSVWDPVWFGYDSIFTFVNVICIFCLFIETKKESKLLRCISANTLGIYLIHDIFIHMTQSYIRQVPILSNVLFDIVYSAALMLLCLGIVIIMKKIPILRELVR